MQAGNTRRKGQVETLSGGDARSQAKFGLERISIECQEGKIHRRDAESAEGAQRKTGLFCSVLTLCSLRLCGEFSGLHYTQSKTALNVFRFAA
jgi:hypothetical protein